jgi:hypothetical protein
VKFRLVYRGPLPAETSRRRGAAEIRMAEAKHRIRSAFRPQIREFWMSHPAINIKGHAFNAHYTEQSLSFWEYYAEQNKSVSLSNHVYRFVPLITAEN